MNTYTPVKYDTDFKNRFALGTSVNPLMYHFGEKKEDSEAFIIRLVQRPLYSETERTDTIELWKGIQQYTECQVLVSTPDSSHNNDKVYNHTKQEYEYGYKYTYNELRKNNFDICIDWGDGTISKSKGTVYFERDFTEEQKQLLTHTYAADDNFNLYDLKITGKIDHIQFYDATSDPCALEFYEVIQWGNLDLKSCEYMFFNIPLRNIPSPITGIEHVTNFCGMFQRPNLSLIYPTLIKDEITLDYLFLRGFNDLPEDLFENAINGLDFSFCFDGCQLHSIPKKFFKNCKKALVFNYCFKGLHPDQINWFLSEVEQKRNDGYITEEIYRKIYEKIEYMKLKTIESVFEDSTGYNFCDCFCDQYFLESAVSVFKNSQGRVFRSCFNNNVSLIEIDSDMFGNSNGLFTPEEEFQSVCYGGWTWYYNGGLNFDNCFYGTSSLQYIPDNIFKNVIVGRFFGCFENSGIKEVPQNLFKNVVASNFQTFGRTFKNCKNLVVHDNIFNLERISDVAYNGRNGIYINDYNLSYIDPTYDFMLTFGVDNESDSPTGEAPPIWNYDFGDDNVIISTGYIYNCTGFNNYSEAPDYYKNKP